MSAVHPLTDHREQMFQDLQRCVPHELRELRAWLLWKLKPKAGRPGEWDKVPYYASRQLRTGRQGGDSDVAQLVDFAEAMAALSADTRHEFAGVGLAVLPCHDVCALDLDKVHLDAERQALAERVTASGSYVERSPSGTGLRAFFRGKPGIGDHKNHAHGVEMFESAGFVTVTGAEVSRGADLGGLPPDLEAAIRERIAVREKVRAPGREVPEWARADLSQLPATLAARLRRGFPDRANLDRSAYVYGLCFALRRAGVNASDAMALLGDADLPWLAPALERRGGDLDSAREWLWRYCIEPAYAQPLEAANDVECAHPEAKPESLSLEQMLARFVHVARGPLIVDRTNTHRRLRPAEFASAFAHCKVAIAEKAVPVTTLWQQHADRMTADALAFNPAEGLFYRERGLRFLNLWDPPEWPVTDAEFAAPFFDHLAYLVPDENERGDLLDWLAHAVQEPAIRPHHHFLLVTAQQGTGRSWIAEVLRRLWGERHAGECDLHRLMNDEFNSALSGKIVMAIQEVKAPADERYSHRERLKSLLTDSVLTVNEKHEPRWTERFCARFLMFTNRDDALPLSETDRRVYAVRCADTQRSAAYYSQLYARLADRQFLAAVWHALASRNLSLFNPGRRAPLTQMKQQMISAGRSDEQQTAVEFVQACPFDVVAADDLMQTLVPDFQDERHAEHKARQNAVGAVLREVGCQTYPKKVKVETGSNSTRVWILRNAARFAVAPSSEVVGIAKAARQMIRGSSYSASVLIEAWTDSTRKEAP